MSERRRTKIYLALGIGGLLFALIASTLTLNYAQLGVAKKRAKDRQNAKLAVLVSVDPIGFFVERIGGDLVDVATLTPPGKDPESFSPTPADLANLASTRLFFRVGLPVEERFAKNVASIAPESKTVDLRDNLELLANEHEHEHGHEAVATANAPNAANAGRSEALDPHLWTSPALARNLATKIAAALAETSPENAELFARNAAEFDAELATLQTEIAARLAPFTGRTFVVFHPAYGYFAREFHLNQRAIESEGKAPRPRELSELIELAQSEGIRAAIVQPEFNRSSAESVANAIGADLIDHSPLEKDYFANLRALTVAVEKSLTPSDDAK